MMPGSVTCSACSHVFEFPEGTREAICPNCGKALPVFLERTPTGPPRALPDAAEAAEGPPEVEVSVITTPIPPPAHLIPEDHNGSNGVLARIPLRKVSANDLQHEGSAPQVHAAGGAVPGGEVPELMVSATLSADGAAHQPEQGDPGLDVQPLAAPIDRPQPPSPPPVDGPHKNGNWVQGSKVIPPLNHDPMSMTPSPEYAAQDRRQAAPPPPAPPSTPEEGIVVNVPMMPVEEVQLNGGEQARPKKVRVRRTTGKPPVQQPPPRASSAPPLMIAESPALDEDLIPVRNLKPLLVAVIAALLALAGVLVYLIVR